MHDLPLLVHDQRIRQLVENLIEKIEEVDLEVGEVEWGEYMRVCVKLNITKPLVRKKRFTIWGLEPVWISFTYKHLLDFCFYYGIIGHGHKYYTLWTTRRKHGKEDSLPYGMWLRVQP